MELSEDRETLGEYLMSYPQILGKYSLDWYPELFDDDQPLLDLFRELKTGYNQARVISGLSFPIILLQVKEIIEDLSADNPCKKYLT